MNKLSPYVAMPVQQPMDGVSELKKMWALPTLAAILGYRYASANKKSKAVYSIGAYLGARVIQALL